MRHTDRHCELAFEPVDHRPARRDIFDANASLTRSHSHPPIHGGDKKIRLLMVFPRFRPFA
jgi:hypothetical protein